MNRRPSSALVPTMSGTRCAVPCRIASTGSRVTGRHRRRGRWGTRPTCLALRRSISRFCAATNSAGEAVISAWVASCLPAPSMRGEPRRRTRAATSLDRVMPLAGLSEITWAKSPSASGECQQRDDGMRAGAFAEHRHIVRVAAEHRDVVFDPAQRQDQIAQKQVAVEGDVRRRQRRQIQTTQRAEAVVDRDIDTAALGQARPVVDRCGRAAHDVSATVHEDHDGQRPGIGAASGATTLRVRQSSPIA